MFVKRATIIQKNIYKLLQKGEALEETKTANTCRRLLKAWDSLWLFVRIEGIESTNNAAERALRQYVIWRKINLGTQSERGDRFIERMFTVIATCKQQGRSVLDFMTQAVQGISWRSGNSIIDISSVKSSSQRSLFVNKTLSFMDYYKLCRCYLNC